MKLSMPMAYGLGIAWRFSDKLTFSFDIYRTEWGDLELEDSNGKKTFPITGKTIAESSIDATHQVRVGAEYLIITNKFIFPLRSGLFYDPAPAESDPNDIWGVSFGTGVVYNRMVFDIAYQFRYGNNIGDTPNQIFGFNNDVREHKIIASLIIHF